MKYNWRVLVHIVQDRIGISGVLSRNKIASEHGLLQTKGNSQGPLSQIIPWAAATCSIHSTLSRYLSLLFRPFLLVIFKFSPPLRESLFLSLLAIQTFRPPTPLPHRIAYHNSLPDSKDTSIFHIMKLTDPVWISKVTYFIEIIRYIPKLFKRCFFWSHSIKKSS